MYKINFDECRNIENSYSQLKKYWYGMNTTSNFGTMTYLYKKYNCPNNYQDFYNYYINDNGNDRTHGRNEDYLYLMAEKLYDYSGLPITVCYNYMCKKLFIDTLDGQKKELEIKNMILSTGYDVKEPNYIQDTAEGIDKLVYKGNKLFCIIQVKPISFFRGNSNYGLIQDRKKALYQEKLCIEKYGVPVIYFIYDKQTNEWVKNSKGNKGHSLRDLINNDGLT